MKYLFKNGHCYNNKELKQVDIEVQDGKIIEDSRKYNDR